MAAYYPWARARLTVSALVSVTIHTLLMFTIVGVFAFPDIVLHPRNQLDVTLVGEQSQTSQVDSAALEAEKSQQGELTTVTDAKTATQPATKRGTVHTLGNAQWYVRPSFHNEQAWSELKTDTLKYRTISAATHESRDAEYLARWRSKVEQFGTRYYQSQIQSRPISGELRLLVSIGPDGQLLQANVRKSSGSPALDAMAIDILEKSAPFDPLPESIRADTDVLEIIRTWRFTAHEGLRSR